VGPWIEGAEARLGGESALTAVAASLARRLSESSAATATKP